MEIDIKALKKLLEMLRAQGITEFEGQGLKLRFGDLPTSKETNDGKDPIIEDKLSEEDLLFWSSQDN